MLDIFCEKEILLRGYDMLKNKRKAVSVILMVLVILATLNCSILSVAAMGVNAEKDDGLVNNTPYSKEDIIEALNNAKVVSSMEDSEFIIANSSIEIGDKSYSDDEYYLDTVYDKDEDEEDITNNAYSNTTPGDPMVYYTQKWLNQEYGNLTGFDKVEENGKTGWATIYGLRKALQHELGITSLSNSFGPTTQKLYSENILKRQDGVTDNKYAILQCALWCKGYNPGYKFNYNSETDTVSIDKVFDSSVEEAVKKIQKDAGLKAKDGIVSLNLMMALLSMDSFKLLPSSYGSDADIRSFQQWLNNNYEAYTGISPCDGVYGRNTNKALIRALQAEEGLPIEIANGNFGNTTQLCCPQIPYKQNSSAARTYPGTGDSAYYSNSNITNFTKLLQFALYVNGFGNGVFNGRYDNATKLNVRKFQEHHAITTSGVADKETWLSLFISCGDRNRKAIAADCATKLTKPKAEALYEKGYRYIGRYLTGTYNGGVSKALTRSEAEIILAAGLNFFPIYQTTARKDSYFTSEQGKSDANSAIKAAKALGLPENTIIYFAVDFDAIDSQITSNIIPYFKAISEEMKYSSYKTGVYGARNVCIRVSEKGYACSSFVGDMSTGFSGNLGYRLPSNWAFDQFSDKDASGNYLSIPSSDGAFEIDKDAFSGRDKGVSNLDSNPDPSISIDTGSTQEEVLYGPTVNIFGKDVPLFQANLSFNWDFIQIETHHNIETDSLDVLMGVNVYGKEVSKYGVREKAGKYNEAFHKVKTIVTSIDKGKYEIDSLIAGTKGDLYDQKLKAGFDFRSYVVGYMTINNKGQIVEGGGALLGETKATAMYTMVPTMYLKFQIEGSIRDGFSFNIDENNNVNVSGDLNFSVKPSAGVEGNLFVANAYMGVSGDLNCNFKLPMNSFKTDFKANFSASVFFEWNALAWGARHDWNFVDLQIYPKAKKTLNVSPNDLQFIKPVGDTASADIKMARTIPNTFKENLQIYAKPKIVSLNNGKMFLTYVDDATDRTEENRFILMYSIYDGTNWSNPQPIFDDGTADFEPTIYPDGTGGVYVVWQNANKEFDENVTLEQMSANMDLYYTHWDGSRFVDTTAVTTNNNKYEMSQRIVSDGNNISIVWQENSENSSLTVVGENSIFRKQCISGIWQQVETMAQNLSTINSVDTSYIDGDNFVVFSTQADNSEVNSNSNKFEIFVVGGTENIKLSNGETSDYSVNFVNGNLYWLSDNSIMVARNGNFDVKQEIKSIDNSVSQIKVICDNNNNTAIVWETEDESGMVFQGIKYEPISGSYGSIYPLAKDSGVVRGWDVCLNSTGNIELAFCYADYTGGNSYGNLCLIQKSEEEYYDIYVSPNTTYTGVVEPNKSIMLSTKIYNSGSKTIDSFKVEISDKNGTSVQSTFVEKSVGIGESCNLEIPFTLPASIEKMEYHITITPADDLNNKITNNQSTFIVGLPDLNIKSVEEIRDGSLRQIKVVVQNNGYSSASSATIKLFEDKFNGKVIGENFASVIQAKEERSFVFTLNDSYSNPVAFDKAKLIYISLESDDAEENYSNNTFKYYVEPDCLITVTSGTLGGRVVGGGTFAKNTIVQISAIPSDGYVFQGWYKNGLRIMDAEEKYSFPVTESSTIEARFMKLDYSEIVAVTNKNVIVDKTNKYLWGLPSGCKIDDYFSATEGGRINQVENTSGLINATGAEAQILSKEDTVIDVYTIIMPGDVNGDGIVDAFDASVIDLHINTSTKLTGAYLAAADINRDGVVNDTDYELCINMVFGVANSEYCLQPSIRKQMREFYAEKIKEVEKK